MNNLGNKEIMAKNIQYYLDLKGKDRNEMCRDLGFKYTTVSNWLQGVKYPRIDKIEMMARYFGITKADLVEDHSAPAPKEESPLSAHEKAMVNAYQKASDKDKYTVDMVLNEYSDEDLPALAEKEKGETDIHSVG